MRAAVGILALQGDVARHATVLERLGVAPREVRSRADLDGLTHLVLPGGESTTLRHLLQLFDLWDPIGAAFRVGDLCLLGTCAGAILLGQGGLGALDIDVERNAYGNQLESFSRWIDGESCFSESCFSWKMRAVFIRAPRITRVGTGVRILARHEGDPVLVEAPGVLASTYHPELTSDPIVHERFLTLKARHAAEAAAS